MKKIVKAILIVLSEFGFDVRKSIYSFRRLPSFVLEFYKIKRQAALRGGGFPLSKISPCLHDKYLSSGSAVGHYFHQDLLVAKKVFLSEPSRHIDVGSRVDGFVAHVATFRPIEVLDIRPQDANIFNINFIECDFMQPIDEELTECCDSLSSLHALEHFGLGRYGDPIDVSGFANGLDNLYRMLRAGGKLYLSVPIGPQRIEFNAHRVCSIEYLLKCFEFRYQIDSFSFVDDRGALHEDTSLDDPRVGTNFGCNYGCGIFELTKV